MKKIVTIGITAYNEGQLLKYAVESVLKQSSSDWELIIVLDGDASIETKNIFKSMHD